MLTRVKHWLKILHTKFFVTDWYFLSLDLLLFLFMYNGPSIIFLSFLLSNFLGFLDRGFLSFGLSDGLLLIRCLRFLIVLLFLFYLFEYNLRISLLNRLCLGNFGLLDYLFRLCLRLSFLLGRRLCLILLFRGLNADRFFLLLWWSDFGLNFLLLLNFLLDFLLWCSLLNLNWCNHYRLFLFVRNIFFNFILLTIFLQWLILFP